MGVASSPHITITANGGMISAGQINAISANTIRANMGLTTYKAPPPQPRCMARRGGPRSKVYCEIYEVVPHEVHLGRGNAKWFSWKDR